MLKIPDSEYKIRIKRVQEEMEKNSIDLLIDYSSECESANVRYLADFWPSFDFAGVMVPREGEPALLTGGPESMIFAQRFSRIKQISIHPGFVETSAPDWLMKAKTGTFSDIVPKVCGGMDIKKIGLAGWNIFPYSLYEDLKRAVKKADIVDADGILFKVRMLKSDPEIKLLEEACRISEEGMKAATDYVAEGKTEWEITAEGLSAMYRLGAEGTPYSIWVCSGPNTTQSLCRSTDRKIRRNELVQLGFGAKYQGYCGNMCRGMVIGEIPKEVRRLMEVGLEAEKKTLDIMGPGVKGKEVYKVFAEILKRSGYEKFALYGPAHGTGLQECEGPWLDAKSELVLQPNMVFNVDIWLADEKHGLRYEDGVVVTKTGIKELTSWRREIITK